MKNFLRFTIGGRFKTILKKSTIQSWYMLFDNEITNIITQHPFIDNFTWIRPKCNHNDYFDSSLDLFSNSNFYLIQNVYPNSIFSIPFIQSAIVDNNGGFMSSPNTNFDSDCSFSIFNKQFKVDNKNYYITDIQGVIRVPNKLHKHAINISKYLKLPPHMLKYNNFFFLKIEASDKSYWNDKESLRILPEEIKVETCSNIEEIYDSSIDNAFNFVKINKNFTNPLIDSEKSHVVNDLMFDFSNIYTGPNEIICIHCQFNINNTRNSCYCNCISKSDHSPYRNSNLSFSYLSRGTGKNPFYFSIQKQLGIDNFTVSEFVGYLDNDKLNLCNGEAELLQRIKVILKLNGSPNVQLTSENVKIVIEGVDLSLLETNSSGEKKKFEWFFNEGNDSIDLSQDKAVFINTNFLIDHLFSGKDQGNLISDSLIVEQIVEYFDIIKNQKIFREYFDINPFNLWEYRFDKFNTTNSSEDNMQDSILSNVHMDSVPSEIVNINGILRPKLIQKYIWFIVSQVAAGNYNWSLIHLEGIDTCNISFRYKPHGNDNNSTNSVNDLYILVFRRNDEIFLISITVVNNNDANI
ncbi:hypothetical protein FG386_002911 [Cryptosporidium ryanae]|uniref:uncharacterized protein n=1 Tax=Cryptosporidium ryanae TaxID=515981 RepID=UPI003519DD06|nr:hypothetical protein FG386_002911 [Cryptosporidium ryanae]